MKKMLPLLFLSYFMFTACSKSDSDGQRRKFLTMILDNNYVLSENPKAFLTFTGVSTDSPNGFASIQLSGFTYKKQLYTFSITSMDSSLHTGTYQSGQSGNTFTLVDSLYNTIAADENMGSFVLNVATIKDSVIQGTFTATLVDTQTGVAHTAQQGAFRTTFSR